MKKFIAILLISAITGGVMHLDELVKIPFLIQHYQEHKANHPGDSALTFLYRHYILDQKAESEKDKRSDSQMPFKSVQNFHSHVTVFICENNTIRVVGKTSMRIFVPLKIIKTSSGIFDIWQPPKVS